MYLREQVREWTWVHLQVDIGTHIICVCKGMGASIYGTDGALCVHPNAFLSIRMSTAVQLGVGRCAKVEVHA